MLALVLLAPAAAPTPALAGETSAEAAGDSFGDLYAAMDAVYGTDQEFERQFRLMMQDFRQIPTFQAIERKEPGIINAMGAAMRPWIKLQNERFERRARPRIMALMKDELSAEDALKLAAYCRTERGRKFLLGQRTTDAASKPSGPRQPLGQPTTFLKPAEGAPPPPPPKPAAAPKPATPEPQDPAVAALLGDPALQARASRFFTGVADIWYELDSMEADKDIQDGMFRDIDYAASTFGWRLFDRPLR